MMSQGGARVGNVVRGLWVTLGQIFPLVWEGMLKNHHRAKRIFSHSMANYMSQLWARKYLKEYLNDAPRCIACGPHPWRRVENYRRLSQLAGCLRKPVSRCEGLVNERNLF